jgi:hypothetical protein
MVENGCHLAKMAIWIMNKGEFKENITQQTFPWVVSLGMPHPKFM